MMRSAEEIAYDVLRLRWWQEEDGEERPKFRGLDKEIAAAITSARREAASEIRYAAAEIANDYHADEIRDAIRALPLPGD